MIRVTEITWLAGLLDGEGAFGPPTSASKTTPRIRVQMTDRDVIVRAAALLGSRVFSPVEPRRAKPIYRADVCGVRAVGWMLTLYGWLGHRRRARIRVVLARWRAAPGSRVTQYQGGGVRVRRE